MLVFAELIRRGPGPGREAGGWLALVYFTPLTRCLMTGRALLRVASCPEPCPALLDAPRSDLHNIMPGLPQPRSALYLALLSRVFFYIFIFSDTVGSLTSLSLREFFSVCGLIISMVCAVVNTP